MLLVQQPDKISVNKGGSDSLFPALSPWLEAPLTLEQILPEGSPRRLVAAYVVQPDE